MKARIALVLCPLAAVAALSAGAAVAADTTTPISGGFSSTDCGTAHRITIDTPSRFEVSVRLSEAHTPIAIETRDASDNFVARVDGTPDSGPTRYDVTKPGTYVVRICPKQQQRDPSDPPVYYNGTITTKTIAAPVAGTTPPKTIGAVKGKTATVARAVSGSGAVSTGRGLATFSVRTVQGSVRLSYRDAKGKLVVAGSRPQRATFGLNSVTVRAGGLTFVLVDQGKRDRITIRSAAGYRVSGVLVRGSIRVL